MSLITTDEEVDTTRERISYFQDLLAQLRITSRPDEFPLVAGGYRAEIERMQADVLEYLTRHSTEPVTARAA